MAVKFRRVPISGWTKCVHEGADFESRGEYAAALILDGAKAIAWWFRNDPPLLRIPTPIGFLEPDFVYMRVGEREYGTVEVKGGIFWNGPDSDAQVKARAAVEWVRAINSAELGVRWEFFEVLDQDVETAQSFEELRSAAVMAEPPA